MANIVGAIATSHTPTIGFALDANKQHDAVWAPIFKAYEPVQQWLQEKQPDVLLVVYNDHVTSFFFDHYSAFALGVGSEYQVADEGGGARKLPPVGGQAALARHIGSSLMADEFDMAFFQNKPLDHGCFSPLSMLWPHQEGWPGQIIPLQVGVLQFPIPTARRCYKLGQGLRRAIESYPEDLDVVIVATGGLSHQVHGERAGFNNTPWDHQFLDLLQHDPEALTRLTHAELATLGGLESAEVIMWLIMRGAMPAGVNCLHREYYLPSMTGIAVAVYEPAVPADAALQAAEVARHREHVAQQLKGIEHLQGTYPFTLETANARYRINRYLYQLIQPAFRERFLADPQATYAQAGLSQEECDMISRRDWQAMIRYGVIFFLLEKLGAVVGVSNLHIYAAMRGQSLEEFQKTRNAPGALYSVAGAASDKAADWNKTGTR
ncbi:gallate dioxygenase [Herbaspirillum sp. RU 5E]|uniref:Protocatechuate 3,4-dioxygenase n=1 Tax=Herbaspirillum aquaticum TaxID=568783 RepID=A0A225SMZ9_9BURK|nr:gallate dioxygenase [Herbaspirillum aquaticum]MBW9333935.1 gallate dioxygenase [Herbaspirillum sp. RU 5E]OWY32441.1 protocatechuate 3,4-dioxygenase [Herbaspirillum aquaticum]